MPDVVICVNSNLANLTITQPKPPETLRDEFGDTGVRQDVRDVSGNVVRD